MYLLALLCIVQAVSGQWTCGGEKTLQTVGDSRLDASRAERGLDAESRTREFFKTRGTSGDSILKSLLTRTFNDLETGPTNDELQLIGVNKFGDIASSPVLPEWSLDRMFSIFLNGNLGYRKVSPVPSVAGNECSTSFTVDGNVCDTGVNCQRGIAPVAIPTGTVAMLCTFNTGAKLVVGGVETVMNSGCIAVNGTTAGFRDDGVSRNTFLFWVMEYFPQKRRNIFKVSNNMVPRNPLLGGDDHLCLVENNCYLVCNNTAEVRSPITEDGLHGSILRRECLRRIAENVATQCRLGKNPAVFTDGVSWVADVLEELPYRSNLTRLLNSTNQMAARTSEIEERVRSTTNSTNALEALVKKLEVRVKHLEETSVAPSAASTLKPQGSKNDTKPLMGVGIEVTTAGTATGAKPALSEGEIIGLSLGAAAAGLSLVGTLVFVWFHKGRVNRVFRGP